jgi:deoxyribodipyrimidine photolyase-related protein
MSAISLVFPHQLFKQHPAIAEERPVWLVEEFLFFKQHAFHKQKLRLHRASMKFYQQWLLQKGHSVNYIDSSTKESDVRKLIKKLAGKSISDLHVCDVTDDWLRRRLQKASEAAGINISWHENPNFITPLSVANKFQEGRKQYFQTDFYMWQRKRLNCLMEPNGSPLGGKWTFDSDNRQKFPANEKVPSLTWPAMNSFMTEANEYVSKHFNSNYGTIDDSIVYPSTFEDAEAWLQQFLAIRFEKFGVYEDAIVQQESFLFHSVLTPMLNIGLLQPQQILDATLQYAASNAIPINSLEGFVRQIIGWREFIRMVYEREGRRQRTSNYWGFSRKIPTSFWEGTTGIVPVDVVIKKVLHAGYNHHIERLMVLGNFFLLCEFDPDEVHRWFMEMYVDAYDWVMVPNVYGMTQFADGGLMTTKPYISGSNYLLKMGDWEKGPWQEIWDSLFWRFMHVHRDFFSSNPRLGMLLKTFDKMDSAKRNHLLQTAEQFLASLDKNQPLS